MLLNIKLFVVTALVFFCIDVFWIGWIADGFYAEHLGHLLAPRPNWVGGALFYGIYMVGLIIFAVRPGVKSRSPKTALRQGALFGFFTYATFDLTCYALFVDFPAVVVVIDILWGTLLCGCVAFLSTLVGVRFFVTPRNESIDSETPDSEAS